MMHINQWNTQGNQLILDRFLVEGPAICSSWSASALAAWNTVITGNYACDDEVWENHYTDENMTTDSCILLQGKWIRKKYKCATSRINNKETNDRTPHYRISMKFRWNTTVCIHIL